MLVGTVGAQIPINRWIWIITESNITAYDAQVLLYKMSEQMNSFTVGETLGWMCSVLGCSKDNGIYSTTHSLCPLYPTVIRPEAGSKQQHTFPPTPTVSSELIIIACTFLDRETKMEYSEKTYRPSAVHQDSLFNYDMQQIEDWYSISTYSW